MGFESVAQGKIGVAGIEGGSVVKNARLRHVVAVACKEGNRGIGAARARASLSNVPRIGHHGRDADKAVRGKCVAATNGAGAEV